MAGFAGRKASSQGRTVASDMAGSQHRVPIEVTSSGGHQYHPGRCAEDAACCYLGEGRPAELDARGAGAVRKAARSFTVTSTCSTADADGQSDLSGSSTDGDASLAGQVWLLSRDPQGCRQVQAALEAAESDAAREALAAELHGHVAKAMRCSHANHVLQKCIALMRPESLQFIVDELLAGRGLVVMAAKHRYACRIVQQTLSKCPAGQSAELVEALLRDAKTLACHAIGHYTIQHVLEVGTEDQRYRLIRTIEKNARSIGLSGSGGAVFRAALTHAAAEDKIWIARAVLQEPEVLLSLASDMRGSAAVVKVLQVLQDHERERACSLLLKRVDLLGSSQFGHAVVEQLLGSSRA